MFENSETFRKYGAGPKKVISGHLGHVPFIEEDKEGERRGRRIAIAAAAVVHILFFVIYVPASEPKTYRVGPKQKVYVVQQVRFQPPPPQQQQAVPKQRDRKKVIPIPDPTPEEPEPILTEELDVPDFDMAVDDVVFGIPETPPGVGIVGGPPMRMGDGIVPPVKIHYPQPRYTEEGRLSRIQGVVILEAVIDAVGDVHNVRVLKGLPMGLSESAVQTAGEWKFRPATLNGQPVPVFLNLTIRFSLQ